MTMRTNNGMQWLVVCCIAVFMVACGSTRHFDGKNDSRSESSAGPLNPTEDTSEGAGQGGGLMTEDPTPPPVVEYPDPSSVTVTSAVMAGSGCLAGDADVGLDETLAILRVHFGQFAARIGGGVGLPESRKVCSTAVELSVPAEWTFRLVAAQTDYGFDLGVGVGATLVGQAYFQGAANTATSENTYVGPSTETASARSALVTEWATCGVSRALNVRTEVRLARVDGIGNGQGTFTVTGPVRYGVEWKRCD